MSKLQVASIQEFIIWERFKKNPLEAGLILSYGFDIQGTLEPELLEKALRLVVESRFSGLQSFFVERNGQLYKGNGQKNVSLLQIPANVFRVSPVDANRSIQHDSDKLYHFVLCEYESQRFHLQLHFSHLVFDGETYPSFCQCLSAAYRFFKEDVGSNWLLPSLDQTPVSAVEQTDVEFWRDKLKGKVLGQKLNFLNDLAPTHDHFFSVQHKFEGAELARINDFCQNYNITQFQFILMLTGITLYKYTEQESQQNYITLSHTVGLHQEGCQLGCHTNIVPFIFKLHKDWTVGDYIEHVKSERRAIKQHQHVPLTELLEFVDEKCNRNAPILNVLVNSSAGLLPLKSMDLVGCDVDLVRGPSIGGPYDFGVNFSVNEDALLLSFDVPSSKISQSLLVDIAQSYLDTLNWCIDNVDVMISRLAFSHSLRPVMKGLSVAYNHDTSVSDKVLMNAVLHPDKVAVEFNKTQLTYRQLEQHINVLANTLSHTATKDQLAQGVGLLLSRSELLPGAMLSALALNIPFVPLDPSLPLERLSYIIKAAELSVILTDQHTEQLLVDELGQELISVQLYSDMGQMYDHDDARWHPILPLSHAAYYFFTSGSTGAPKGVKVGHDNLLNFLHSMRQQLGLDEKVHCLALTSIGFDISILELLLPLFCGGTVDIVDEQTRVSANLLAEKINNSFCNTLQATPSTYRLLKNVEWYATRAMTVLTGGEAVDADLVKYLTGQGHIVYNMYGPTETTIWSSLCQLTHPERISIGEPIHNCDYYVLNDAKCSVKDGMIGQLVIHGDCVSQGYINHDSEEVFINLPGLKDKAYCTGDMVRYLGDGRLEYVGRRDHQYKINGHRIELGEINTRLQTLYPDIDLFTVVRSHPEKHLLSFYYCSQGRSIDADECMTRLRAKLPTYMVPQGLYRLSSIPLTPNGKANIKHLSESPLSEIDIIQETTPVKTASTAPQSKQQSKSLIEQLRGLVKELLDVDIDNPESPLGWLGLNSISYNKLSHGIFKKFDVTIPAHQFYQLNTLNGIVEHIDIKLFGESSASKGAERSERKDLNATFDGRKQDIAIVGYAMQLPGAEDPQSFWQILLDEQDMIRSAPVERGFQSDIQAGFIDDISHFDARFFSISPLEAVQMDPRQRLLLQNAWQTLEDAGYARDSLAGKRVGCYVAATGSDYTTLLASTQTNKNPYSLSGTSLSILANRISNFFDWRGPSFTMDTACSGALSALVKACNDLSFGVCESALVGGVNIIADEQISAGLQAGHFLSERHRCATFDAEADGYVRGEGVGCLLLKRLDDAVADGDSIHAVVKSYVENHGGRSNSLTAPNPDAQYELLLDAYSPKLYKQVSYIETHGTGTKLGDPIEIDAIKRAWRSLGGDNTHQDSVYLGSVKTNIGHLEAAAGIASLAKVMLSFKHRYIPGNLHFKQLNPRIDLSDTPFKVLDQARPWQSNEPLTAGVSSFGFGGANAHVVLCEPPKLKRIHHEHNQPYVVILSARSQASLSKMAANLLAFLHRATQKGQIISLCEVAATLAMGRTHFEHRCAWVVNSIEDLQHHLVQPLKICTIDRAAVKPDYQLPQHLTSVTQLMALRDAYLSGAQINWVKMFEGDESIRVHLPTYPFDCKPYWLA